MDGTDDPEIIGTDALAFSFAMIADAGILMHTSRVEAAWGGPHLHSGIGIRRLTKTVFECRVGLDDRVAFVFAATPRELVFFFPGNHGAIARLIRSMR